MSPFFSGPHIDEFILVASFSHVFIFHPTADDLPNGLSEPRKLDHFAEKARMFDLFVVLKRWSLETNEVEKDTFIRRLPKSGGVPLNHPFQ